MPAETRTSIIAENSKTCNFLQGIIYLVKKSLNFRQFCEVWQMIRIEAGSRQDRAGAYRFQLPGVGFLAQPADQVDVVPKVTQVLLRVNLLAEIIFHRPVQHEQV